MATIVGTLAAERWLDEVLVKFTASNVDGDVDDFLQLPAGLGDVAVIEVNVQVFPLATVRTNPELAAVLARIVTASGVVDIVGVENFQLYDNDGVAAYLSPDPLVLWRQDEYMRISWPELDTNAVPTGDTYVYVKAVRVRPIEAPASTQIQLVRSHVHS